MSDEPIVEGPTAQMPAAEQNAPVAGPMTTPSVPAPPTPSSGGVRSGTWIASVAAALVLAVVLSGVSFGAGVFVGRQTDRIGGRSADIAQQQRLPGYGMPGQQGGERMMPNGQDGQAAPQGMPGQGMRGGRGFRGAPSGTETPPPVTK